MNEEARSLKKQIRKEVMADRKSLPLEQATANSESVFANVKKSGLIDKHDHIMAYMDFRNEVQTTEMIEYMWGIGKSVYIPLVNNDDMSITVHKIENFEDMSISSFGIREPNPEKTPPIDANAVELILAPGVAFSKDGYRIGYGAGCYDRLLSIIDKKPVVAALAFELQMVPKVPHEDHDVKMDFIITEAAIYEC
jgi:5-formyltetrahydrofolate cyclo-ligase